MIFSLCHDASRIDFVFDSYLTGSVKDSERQRRAKTRPIEISSISNDTPLPVQMDTFWASGTNKVKLQSFLAASAQNKIGNTELILSRWSSDEGATLPQVIQSSQNIDPDKLVFDIEEADLRIIPHAIDCANNASKRLVILSNDTDVTIVTLYYWSILQSIGHQDCWVKFGVSNTTRYIPLHTLAERIGSLTKFLPSVHALTGNDIISKFGTKFSALKISPEKYLTYFGKKPDGLDINMVLADAEQFLVQVLKPGSKCKSLDELRHYMYHYNKSTTIDKLPPTSCAARSHLLRAFLSAFEQTNCHTRLKLNPLKYGFKYEDGLLVPEVNQRLIPGDLVLNCNCEKCVTTRCTCCMFCKCQKDCHDGTSSCENNLTTLVN